MNDLTLLKLGGSLVTDNPSPHPTVDALTQVRHPDRKDTGDHFQAASGF